jgi:hypothetical protein
LFLGSDSNIFNQIHGTGFADEGDRAIDSLAFSKDITILSTRNRVDCRLEGVVKVLKISLRNSSTWFVVLNKI